jgi:hypothetical protein
MTDEQALPDAATSQPGHVEDDPHAEHLLSGEYEIENSAGSGSDDEGDDLDIDPGDQREQWEPPAEAGYVDPAVHELMAQLLWDSHGLAPYRDLADAFQPVRNDEAISFEFAGDQWRVWYADDGPDDAPGEDAADSCAWESGIADPEDPDRALEEFQLVVVQDDGIHDRRAQLQFRPAIPGSEAYKVGSGEPIQGIPDALPRGLRVRVTPAENVAIDELEPLIRAAVQALGVDEQYLPAGETHEWSRATGLGLYLRMYREPSERCIVPRDGVLERIGQFSAARPGYVRFEADNREIVGHSQEVVLDEAACEKLFSHREPHVAKTFESYHTAQPAAEEDPDEPITSPKLEVQWHKDSSTTTAIPWDSATEFDVHDLLRELDEALLNVVSWSGLPVGADPNTYRGDAYHDVTASERDIDIVASPLDELREREQDLVTSHMQSADARDSERRVLETLIEEFGDQVYWETLADAADTSKSVVYDAAQAFNGIIEVVDGVVRFEDDVVREKATRLLQSAADAVERVQDSLAALAADHSRTVDPDSPFGKWARRYFAEISRDHHHDRLEIELTGEYTYRELLQALRAGYEAARATGRHCSDRFLDAWFVWYDSDGQRQEGKHVLSDNATVRILGEDYAFDV